MTRINDYLWELPHSALPDDPEEVLLLQQEFNSPLVAALEGPLRDMGYELKSSDVAVRLDERFDRTLDTYYANVRFIRYLRSEVITRVHFQHTAWGLVLPSHHEHRYYINLDRFKIADPVTQTLVPAWSGRLHTRMSNRPGDILEHNGEDQIWCYLSAEDLEQQLQLFLDKFARLGRPWLENPAML